MDRSTARQLLWPALGLGTLAVYLLASGWIERTAELSVVPLPGLASAGLLLLLAALRPALSGRPAAVGLVDGLAALVLALVITDLVHRWDPAPLAGLGLDGLAERMVRNTRLHVRPAFYEGAGVAAAVLLVLLVGVRARHLTLRPGEPAATATSLDARGRTNWRAVSIRFVCVVVLAEVGFLWVRGADWDPGGPWILIPIALGMAVMALAEEVLFRGLLRPLAERALGPALGNLLQALLFGLAHVSVALLASGDPRLAPRELVRLGLWVLLGWFFGLAARDTRGLAVPVSLHLVLGLAIYVSLVFKPATGILG